MTQHEPENKSPLIQALVLILAGLVLSYTGAFYFGGSTAFAIALVALGVIFPLWALRILWKYRNEL